MEATFYMITSQHFLEWKLLISEKVIVEGYFIDGDWELIKIMAWDHINNKQLSGLMHICITDICFTEKKSSGIGMMYNFIIYNHDVFKHLYTAFLDSQFP